MRARIWAGAATLLIRVWMAAGLVALVGWPTTALVLEIANEPGTDRQATGEAPFAFAEVARPLGLARETLRLVLATEAIALPVGVVLALLIFRTDAWGRRGLIGLVTLAVFLPTPLHALAWLGAFGNLGRAQWLAPRPILVGWSGAAFVHAMAAVPWVALLAGVGLRSVEPESEDAARLDLPAWRVLLRVTARRSVGAIVGAALVVAVLTAGDMTVTDLLAVRTYAEEAYIQFQLSEGLRGAAAVAVPPLVVLGVGVALAARGLLRADPARIPSARLRAKPFSLGRWRVPIGLLLWATIGAALLLPITGLIWRAGRLADPAAPDLRPTWSPGHLFTTLLGAWAEVFSQPHFIIPRSLAWAALGATLTTSLAWPLAWSSRRPGPWRWMTVATVVLTLACPGPVAGVALIVAYRSIGPIYNSIAVLILAYILRTLPYTLLVLWPSLRSFPEAYLESAALDGYGPWGLIRRVVLPLSLPALGTTWGVSFALALGELPAAHLVQPPGHPILTERIWEMLHFGVESRLAGIGLIVLTVLAIAGLLASRALSRSLGLPQPDDPS